MTVNVHDLTAGQTERVFQALAQESRRLAALRRGWYDPAIVAECDELRDAFAAEAAAFHPAETQHPRLGPVVPHMSRFDAERGCQTCRRNLGIEVDDTYPDGCVRGSMSDERHLAHDH